MKRSFHRLPHLLLMVALLLTFAAPAFAEGSPTLAGPEASYPQTLNYSEDVLSQLLLEQLQITENGQVLLHNVVIKPQTPYLIRFSEKDEIKLIAVANNRAFAAHCGECTHNIDDPHHSHHRPGRVNIVAWSKCNTSGSMHVFVALFRGGKLQSTGYKEGSAPGKVKVSAATACHPGLYFGISLHWGVVGGSYAFLMLSHPRSLQCP